MISQKTLQHPILMLIIFALLGTMGIFTLGNLSISLFPDVDNPYLMISATYTNAGPESVEKTVTTPIENALVSVSNLKNITSTSSEGSCRVSLEFNYGTDLESAFNDVRDKLDRVSRTLPDGVTPSIMKMNGNNDSIMRIAMRGNRSADDLKLIAENTVVDVLAQADGVAEASVMGGRTKIVRVELEQNRLQAYGLALSTVASALSRQNIELGGGSITEDTKDYSIRTTGEYTSIDEINDTVIQSVKGYDVKLSDLGRAFMGYQDASSEVYINGQPGVYVSVSKQSGKNSVTVANAVYKKIDELKSQLPEDVSMEIVSDSTESIRDTISTLFESAWQGLLLAIIILYVFLCSFKSTIIIGISIPLSILITLLCMNFAGITLNMMTLTGLILGVGMIVDASVVMIDNIYSYRERGTKANVAAILGSQEMIMSVVSGNLTTICVFVPFLFYLKDLGMMGQMFKGLIFTIVIALVSSLFVAIFLVPVLAGHFFPLTNRKEKPLKSIFFRTLYGFFNGTQDIVRKVYRVALRAALNNRLITIAICLTALIVSLLFIPTMRITMMTGGSDSSVTITANMPVGTTLSETSKVVSEFEKIVEQEVQGYTTIITSIGGGRNSSYSGSIQINLPTDTSVTGTSAQIQEKLRKHFQEFTNASFTFGRGMRQQLTGDDLDIVVRSSSLDLSVSVANQIMDVMGQLEDVGEPSLDVTDGLPQVEIKIDRTRAASFGVNVSTVATEIQACIQGKSATVYRKDGEDYSVYVLLRPQDRSRILDLAQIYVQGTGGLVSVGNFATVSKGLGPVSIRHENRARLVHVTAGILGDKNANEVENEIKDAISSTLIIPDGVSISYEGSWKTMNEQGKIYGLIGLMAILLVFGVMAATYESFKAPIINLMTIPFLIIGVIAIYKISGQVVSMLSAIGLIMLVGIVVNNGIILVDYTNLLLDRGMKMKEACLEAGSSRLRPVLMTTLTTILGMLPMCFATTGSAGMVQPIGMAVVGGLTSSTFITLFFIPVVYSLIMKEKQESQSRIQVQLPAAEEPPEEQQPEKAGTARDIHADEAERGSTPPASTAPAAKAAATSTAAGSRPAATAKPAATGASAAGTATLRPAAAQASALQGAAAAAAPAASLAGTVAAPASAAHASDGTAADSSAAQRPRAANTAPAAQTAATSTAAGSRPASPAKPAATGASAAGTATLRPAAAQASALQGAAAAAAPAASLAGTVAAPAPAAHASDGTVADSSAAQRPRAAGTAPAAKAAFGSTAAAPATSPGGTNAAPRTTSVRPAAAQASTLQGAAAAAAYARRVAAATEHSSEEEGSFTSYPRPAAGSKETK
ncbi:MAG TPA: AcrB/AcrD/AcrF family protein [Treponema sp.]|nr:AcrB/AcrD/AcrF family protein [Treponema sp.]